MTTFIRRHARLLLALTAVLGLGAAVYGQRDAVAAVDWTIAPLALVAAAALFAVPALVQALTFGWALRLVGARPPARELLRVWGRSFLLRYEPSGAVGFVYRVTARERLGATTPQVLTATGYEQLAAVVGGALAAPAGFLIAGLDPPPLALGLCAAAVLLAVALRPAWLGGVVRDRLAARGIATAEPVRGRVVALLVAVQAAGWVAVAFGADLLLGGLGLEVGTGLVLGAFALSWLLGVLVPLAPGGLGLREGSLVLSLGATLGTGVATGAALALRVVSFAGELIAVAITELLALVLPAGRSVAATVPAGAPVDRAGVIVVVPTFNEAEMLPLFAERFAATGLELLVVDDSSPDGTGAVADELAASRPWMHVLHRSEKDGLGMAYRAGFTWCLAAGYRAVGQMDCDLSHPPEKLAEMLAVLDAGEADLVIANRYLPGGGTANWSRGRRALSRVGCTMSKLALGLPYDDLSGGFKLWRASCLAELGLDGLLSAGYAFQVETTQVAHLMGKRIEEVPFVFSERLAGESKMSLAISLEGIGVTLALRRRGRALVA